MRARENFGSGGRRLNGWRLRLPCHFVTVHGLADSLEVQVGGIVYQPAGGGQHVRAVRELPARIGHFPAQRVVVTIVVRARVVHALTKVHQTPHVVVRPHAYRLIGTRRRRVFVGFGRGCSRRSPTT